MILIGRDRDVGSVAGIERIDLDRAARAPAAMTDRVNWILRLFERLSYALVLEINDTVQVGDKVTNPR